MAKSQKRERSCLNISRRTKDDLDSIKHSGQSYDGLIQELVKFWKDEDLAIQVEKIGGKIKEERSGGRSRA